KCIFCKKKQDKKIQIELPQREFELVQYNLPAGSRNINILKIIGKRRIVSDGVISPDKSKMAFSEIYFYPQKSASSSRIYYIDLTKQKNISLGINKFLKTNISQKEQKPLVEAGMKALDTKFFRILTIVDWNEDSGKLLAKEDIGEFQGGIWTTDLWIYDFNTNFAYKLDSIKDDILYYCKKYYNTDLTKYKWNIEPLGWNMEKPDSISINIYGYNYGIKEFFGSWRIDSNSGQSYLVSKTDNKVETQANGFVVQEKTKND
ncbi:MAG: hypothetical protein PHV68_06455, partial [Candidatus Gastranaerophilales bacterium]|nr:hypothetical protein [Candidatus Gastranaerophilales bacterium]